MALESETVNSEEKEDSKPELQPPTFCKVIDLTPSSVGFSVNVKIGKIKRIMNRLNLDGTRLKISEAEAGDETAFILLSLRNDQIEQVNEGDVLILRNAKIDMVDNGHMRCAVDRWGLIDKADTQQFEEVDFEAMRGHSEKDMSAVEYELKSEPIEYENDNRRNNNRGRGRRGRGRRGGRGRGRRNDNFNNRNNNNFF